MILSPTRAYREALEQSLKQTDQFTVVGTTANVAEALAVAAEQRADLVVVDHDLPDAIAAIRALVNFGGALRVLVLGVPETDRDVIACAEAGAAGYVSRHASLTELQEAMFGVARGELQCSPKVAASLFRRLAARAAGRTSREFTAPLTSRELEIAAFLEQGRSNKEIASALGIGLVTVKSHVHHILTKLKARSRGEAAARLRGVRNRRSSPQRQVS